MIEVRVDALKPGDVLLPGNERVISINLTPQRAHVVVLPQGRKRSEEWLVALNHSFEIRTP